MNSSAGATNINAQVMKNTATKKISMLNRFANSIKGIKKLNKLLINQGTTNEGDAEKTFRRRFNVRQGEKLVKACQCQLWTTAGPISGFLFISSDKMAFCSNKSLRLSSSPSSSGSCGGDQKSLRFHYKVVIPLNKINRVNRSQSQESMKKKNSEDHKYLRVITKDQFEFWFLESSC